MARGRSLETRLLHPYQLLSLKSAGLLVFLTLYIQIRGRTLRAIYSTKSYQPLGFRRAVQLHIIHKRMAWLKDSRSLLQLLPCYVETEDDWEKFLPMLMFAYCTAAHSSTNLSPFELMFGRPPCTIPFQTSCKFDTSSLKGE